MCDGSRLRFYDTRVMIAGTQRAIPNTIEEQKLLESQIQLEVDPTKHAQLEFELKRAKSGIEQYKAQLDSLKEREQELATELRAQQTKLDELESRLDLIERAIENDRQKLEVDKPAPEKEALTTHRRNGFRLRSRSRQLEVRLPCDHRSICESNRSKQSPPPS